MLRALIFALAMFILVPAHAAGFNCAKAGTPDEHAVCDDPRLSDLDSLLARAHAQVKAGEGAEDVRQASRDFLADRRACGADGPCILSAYLAVLRQLGDLGASVDVPAAITAETIAAGKAPASKGLPERVGRCTATAVDSVHPRLGEGDGSRFTDADFDSGTGIEFRNGGYQVSYSREPALIASKPGDRVVMCLVSLPHHCPPGDDRGRTYMVTNARTGGTWLLADSQHMCGGA